MEMEIFAEKIRDAVRQRLGQGCRVTVCGMAKNNGVTYTGLCVAEEGSAVSPLICLDGFHKMYENGEATLEEAAGYAINASRRAKPKVNINDFLEYRGVEGRIVYRLINTGRNREMLGDVPHLEFLDLSIVFQCMMPDGDYGAASILVHNAHMKLWGVSIGELYRAAVKNTPLLMEYEFRGMDEVIREITEKEQPEDYGHDGFMEGISQIIPVYVLSNRRHINGAASILYPRLLKEISGRTGGSFYIIPSSVHEVLVLPSDNTDDAAEIRAMIREVNDTQVKEEEILSYSLYYYDTQTDTVSICG